MLTPKDQLLASHEEFRKLAWSICSTQNDSIHSPKKAI